MSYNEQFFEKIDTAEKAYILGFFAADGNISKKQNILKIDQKSDHDDIVYKIAKEMGASEHTFQYTQKSHFTNSDKIYITTVTRLAINNKKLHTDIQQYGITPNKSNSLTINFELIPKEFIKDFLRGLYEGDGSYAICHEHSKSRKSPLYQVGCTMSVNLKDQIQEILNNKFPGITTYSYHRSPKNKQHCSLLICNKEYILSFLKWLYTDVTIYQQYKYDKAQNIIKILSETQETILTE